MGRLRALPRTYGRTTLILLAAILAIGFGLRAYRVAEPLATPGDDAHAYYDLAKSLYEEGSYGSPDFRDASDWSPGAPLLYSASFYATGGAREGTARIVEMLLGLAAIVVVFLLGRRIACGPAGLIAALGVAVYPPFIHSTGALFSEPPAIFTLPAAILAFLWAAGLGRDASSRARWLVPGLLFGITALIRPEYLMVGAAFAVYALAVEWRKGGWRPGRVAIGAVRRRLPAADRALDGAQRDRARPRRADLYRRRQGALRRHLPARRRRVPAGQGTARGALPRPRARARLGRARSRRPGTALRPRRPALPRSSA